MSGEEQDPLDTEVVHPGQVEAGPVLGEEPAAEPEHHEGPQVTVSGDPSGGFIVDVHDGERGETYVLADAKDEADAHDQALKKFADDKPAREA
jgi:hypothetical protein